MNLPEKIQSESDLRQLLSYLIDILGWGFHPDDNISDYGNEDGTPMFNEQQTIVLERLMDESFDFCEQNDIDIYGVSLAVSTEKFGEISEELYKSVSL